MTATDPAGGLLQLTVRSKTPKAEGVVLVELAHPGGEDLPRWEPGAHIDLHLGQDIGIRQYSLCSSPTDRSSYAVAVLREDTGRGGSVHVHDRLQPGQRLPVSPPRNNFALVAASRYRFIAGGIGITPVLPMIEFLERRGADWTLLYGGRTRDSMAFRDELHGYGSHRVVLRPQDQYGLLDLAQALTDPHPGEVVYACGPGPLLDAVRHHTTAWPADALHLERFSADEDALAGPTSRFDLELRRSGLQLTVPADQSIVDVVEAAGVAVVTSCMEGTCGSCETPVLAGDVDHRDSVLTPAEQSAGTTMMICVSRARGPRLVLDL
ncbi:PDR/VanB family oxidoreductase [Blastococcus sp. SYSU D00820]